MKAIETQPIFLEGTKQTFLLLHSFTGNANEMKGLAKHLHELGHTCYAPNLKGHGKTPGDLMQASMEEAHASAEDAFQLLLSKGYEKIIVIGQSLGGLMAMRIAASPKCAAIAVLSSPIFERPLEDLEGRVIAYTKRYFKQQQASTEEIESYLSAHFPRPTEKMQALLSFITESQQVATTIHKPIALFKGELDYETFQKSVDFIFEHAKSELKFPRTYVQSGHLLTIDKDRKQVFEDLAEFAHLVNSAKTLSQV